MLQLLSGSRLTLGWSVSWDVRRRGHERHPQRSIQIIIIAIGITIRALCPIATTATTVLDVDVVIAVKAKVVAVVKRILIFASANVAAGRVTRGLLRRLGAATTSISMTAPVAAGDGRAKQEIQLNTRTYVCPSQ